MIIGFTGTRMGMNIKQWTSIYLLLAREHSITEIHHGDCVGSDEDFHNMAVTSFDIPIVIHPPDNDKHRAFCEPGQVLEEKPYLDRNKDIVDTCDLLIATPGEEEEQLRSGTWSTIRYARSIKRDYIIFFPSGREKAMWKI